MWERETIRANNEGKDSKVNFKESKDDYSKTVRGEKEQGCYHSKRKLRYEAQEDTVDELL